MKTFKSLLMIGLSAALTMFSAVSAADNSYPKKTITFICTHERHSDLDVNTRLLAKYLSASLETKVDVINAVGANGVRAMELFKDEIPDGYTLLSTRVMALMSNHYFGDTALSYKDFAPIAIYGQTCGDHVVVSEASPYTTFEELIDAAKENPDEISITVAMNGQSYLAAKLFETRLGAKFAIVDAGSNDLGRLEPVLNGQVDATIVPYATARPYLKARNALSLANLDYSRLNEAPDVPNVTEFKDARDIFLSDYFVLLAPKNTPQDVIDLLSTEINDLVLTDVDFLEDVKRVNYKFPYALDTKGTMNRLQTLDEQFSDFRKEF